MAQIEDLLNQASEIRNADQEKENTAQRVGKMLMDIIQHIAGFVSVEGLQAVLADYAPLQGALVHWRNSRVVCLASMGSELDNIDGGDWQYTNHAGDIVFNPSGRNLSIVGEQGNYSVFPGVFYVNLHSRHCYVWDATTQAMIEITDSSRPTIIDYRNNPPFAQVAIGESYYFESGSAKKIAIKTSSSGSYSFDPDPKKIYVFKDTCESMIWNATTRSWITVGSNNSGVAPSLISQIISNIDLVNGRINTLIDDLAGMAFSGAKTAKTDLDWDGTKVTVSLNTSGLSGCKVQETFPKQVLEGSSASITIVPTNDSHLLRSASYKIGSDGEVHEVAVSGNKAVINLSRINENITVYLTASATAKGSFTAGISDSRVSGTGETSGIVEGSAWLSQLSLNNTAEEGASITSITAAMEGGGSIDVIGNMVSTNNVTGNIHITATVAVVGRVSLSFPALTTGVKITDNNNNNAVVNDGVSSLTLIENSSISWKIGAIEGYRLSGAPTIRMSTSGQIQQTITPVDNGDGTYSLTMNRITGDVTITATAIERVCRKVTKKLLNVSDSNTLNETPDDDFGYPMQSVEDGAQYRTTLNVDNGATSNNDVKVFMGGEDITSTAYNSSTGEVEIRNVTDDVVIVATAATGTIVIDASDDTSTVTINGTEYSTSTWSDATDGGVAIKRMTLSGITSISSLVFSDKSKILAFDGGGAVLTNTTNADYTYPFGGINAAAACVNVKRVVGIVMNGNKVVGNANGKGAFFSFCTSLEEVSTIGWVFAATMLTIFAKNTKIEALDLEHVSVNGSCSSMFEAASSLRVLRLGENSLKSCTGISSAFSGCSSLAELSLGNADNITGFGYAFKGATSLIELTIGKFDAANAGDVSYPFLSVATNGALICTTTEPPTVNANKNWVATLPSNWKIYVPDGSVTTYQAATGWSDVASRIKSITEYNPS